MLRLEGLEVDPVGAAVGARGPGLTAVQKRRRAIGKSLAQSGYVEVLPTPFLPAGVFDLWGLPADDPRRATTQVLNPLEADRPELATTLLPGLLEALGRNVSRGLVDVALFAIAQVVPADRADPRRRARSPSTAGRPTTRSPCSTRRCPGNRSTSPRCWPGCANRAARGARAGRPKPPTRSRRCESSRAPAESTSRFRAAQYLPWHPGRCAEVLVGETAVGHAGQLHPAVIERSGLPKGTCAVELNLDAIPIVEALPAPRVSPFPAVFQDVSLVVPANVPAQAVADAVREGAGELLEDIQLFDVFTGPQVGEDRKSLTFALRFRAPGSHADRRRGQRRPRCRGATRR